MIRPDDRRPLLVTVLGVAFIGWLTYCGFWTSGGDSDFFASAARSIANGDGYRYNGEAVAISPPGWPVVLASLLKISPSYLFLNAVQATLLAIGLLSFYPILRHIASPWMTCVAILVTASLHPVYPMGFWLHSEPLFLILCNASLLLTLRLRHHAGWFAGVLVLVLLALTVRYAAVFQAVLLVPLLFALPRRRAMWMSATLLASVGIGLMVLTNVLDVTRVDARPAFDQPTTEPGSTVAQESLGHGDFTTDAHQRHPIASFLVRLLTLGTWPMLGLWYPSRFVTSLPMIGWIVPLIGWGVIILMVRGCRSRLGWAALGFLLAIGIAWPNPNARYLLPVLPILIVLIGRGIDRWWLWGLTTILLANVPLLAVDSVIRKVPSMLPSRFEAGSVAPLVAAIDQIDGPLVISERVVNFGQIRRLRTGARATHLLLDRPITPLADGVPDEPDDPMLVRWLTEQEAVFYLYQEPYEPWRLWHFRLGTGSTGGWQLWEVREDRLERLELPAVEAWPRRVPGVG